MLHLTCGDLAGDSVRALLARLEPEVQVRVLRDDLAVGPLNDVDSCALRCSRRILGAGLARRGGSTPGVHR